MPRLNIDTTRVPLASQNTLKDIHAAFGATPNMFKLVANSPAALKSMWGSFASLGSGTLGAKLGEQIAVAIAERNRCEYCLAAHTLIGTNAGATVTEMAAAQKGEAADVKTAAALQFALKLVNERGRVSAAEVERVRAAGYGDEQIMEIVAHVALNLFTNYVNNAFETTLDFPKVALNAS